MNNFDFSKQKLDLAFRTLCSKLYLKAESQQIDRIIQAFAKRYYECNPNTLYNSIDVIHTVAYSMLLLNTDLHIVNDKMTKSSFIKNTMETIHLVADQHQLTRAWLSDIENSLKVIRRSTRPGFFFFNFP